VILESWKKIVEENRVRLGRKGFYHTSLSEQFCDILAHYVCPIFLNLKISANLITFFEVVLGVIGALVMSGGTQQTWIAGLLIYALGIQLDHIDGKVARATNTATYFGYFIDGYSGVFVLSVVRLALVISIFKQFSFSLLFMMALLVLFLTPFYVFIYDKYAAMARRINQERGLNIKPYIRNEHLKAPSNMVVDLERVGLGISMFNFTLGIWIYLLINIILEIGFISYHIYFASQQMRVSNAEMSRS
jgi:phosphatidylglycerophosphate synthase